MAERGGVGGGEKKGGEKGGGRGNWTEEGRMEFMRKFGKMGEGEREVEEECSELRERIKGAMAQMGKERRRKRGRVVGFGV